MQRDYRARFLLLDAISFVMSRITLSAREGAGRAGRSTGGFCFRRFRIKYTVDWCFFLSRIARTENLQRWRCESCNRARNYYATPGMATLRFLLGIFLAAAKGMLRPWVLSSDEQCYRDNLTTKFRWVFSSSPVQHPLVPPSVARRTPTPSSAILNHWRCEFFRRMSNKTVRSSLRPFGDVDRIYGWSFFSPTIVTWQSRGQPKNDQKIAPRLFSEDEQDGKYVIVAIFPPPSGLEKSYYSNLYFDIIYWSRETFITLFRLTEVQKNRTMSKLRWL